jgi:hypothetical protein
MENPHLLNAADEDGDTTYFTEQTIVLVTPELCSRLLEEASLGQALQEVCVLRTETETKFRECELPASPLLALVGSACAMLS